MHKTLTGIYEWWYFYGHFHFTFQNVVIFFYSKHCFLKENTSIMQAAFQHHPPFVQPLWSCRTHKGIRGHQHSPLKLGFRGRLRFLSAEM